MKDRVVYVFRTSPQTLRADMGRVLEIPESKCLQPEKETFIKLNANYDRKWPGCNTSNWFLDSLLKSMKDKGFTDLKAVEGDLKLQPAIRTIRAVGIDRVLEKYNVPFIPLENLPRENELPICLQNAQLVSTPVFHTHTFAVISIAAKNLYGILPVYREKYHNILSEKLLELTHRIPVFSIVDGTVGLDGGSMRMGNPVKTNLIMAGWNPVAIDVIAAEMMGFSIEKVPYLRLAQEKDLIGDIIVRGDYSRANLPTFKFTSKTPLLARLDLWLHRRESTGKLLEYNSFFDRLANHARRVYTGCVYHAKKAKVLTGEWREYAQVYNEKF